MNAEERIKQWKLHDSIRGQFSFELYKSMALNKNIYLLTGDLGWGIFDNHKEDFGDRFINTGASEQSLMGIAVGLALSNKIPFVYSITPFLIYRPFETIRTYINHENIKVIMIGSGRDKSYIHDGFSHDASDIKLFLDPLVNIKQYFPDEKEQVPKVLNDALQSDNPSCIILKR
jgi:transketolase